MKDELGNRMKENYENRYRIELTRRMPVILRLDGKAFHTFTRHCERPFDKKLIDTMETAGELTCQSIQGSKCCYIQSDEVSILVTDFDELETSAWFDYNLQKMVSVASSTMTANFNYVWNEFGRMGLFDCRAFNIPKEEVTNYFIWRQKDWIRNSLSMYARGFFSQKDLHKKNSKDMHEMLHTKGKNWADLDPKLKNGTFIYRDEGEWKTSYTTIFTKDREAVEKYLYVDE